MYRNALQTLDRSMLQEFKKKSEKSAQPPTTKLLQVAYAVGKVLPTQETETTQSNHFLLI